MDQRAKINDVHDAHRLEHTALKDKSESNWRELLEFCDKNIKITQDINKPDRLYEPKQKA